MIGPEHMKSLIVLAALLMSFVSPIPAQEESASPATEKKSYPEVPKEYEVGESTVSPNGRFAILYPVRNEDSNGDPGLPNLLVRLKPYAVLQEIERGVGVTWKGGRGAADAKWNGNDWVAVWHHRKWGDEDLVVYEIANDKIKREEKIWPEVVTFEFKGRSLSLNILAENRPNLAPGPHWSAELHAVWNLDKAKFEKVDFKPGEIEVRKQLE